MAGRNQKEPIWVQPFMASLARTGNARLAAVEAGIDHTTAYQRRLKRRDFAEAWARVLEERDPCASASPADGCGQVSRSAALIERVSANHGSQIVRAGIGRWSKRGEAAFLAELAASANVKRACAAAGFSTQALYKRRLANRRFAEAWDAAVAVGRARVDAYLVEAADRTFDPASFSDQADIPKMTIAEAIKVAQLGKAGAGKAAAGRGWVGEESWDDPHDEESLQEVRNNIVGRLHRIREREEGEKIAAGWTKHGDDWVPPGYAPVVDLKALPEPDAAEAEEGPRVRGL